MGARVDFDTVSYVLWELNEANSWEEKLDISDLLALSQSDYVAASPILKSNKVLCFVYDTEDFSKGMRFYLIDFELEDDYRELQIDTSRFIKENSQELLQGSTAQLWSLNNDRLLVQDSSSSLFIIDITRETIEPVPLQETDSNRRFLSAAELDETVYMLYEDAADHYASKLGILDVSTGSFSSLDENKYEGLAAMLDDDDSRESFGVLPALEGDSSFEDRIIICLGSGIYELSNNIVKKVVDGEETVMYNPAELVLGCTFDSQDDFFLFCVDTNASGLASPYALYKYTKTVDTQVSSTQLRIFSLEDDPAVRQAVALFKDEHPNVEVKLEIGMSSEGITAEDALRNLDIELLAGEGPDILLLDGLPTEKYIQYETLHDLTEIYTEALSSELYYDNVINAFVFEGHCYALPMRYTFPLVTAARDKVDRLDSLSALVELARETVAHDPNSMVFCNMAVVGNLLTATYPEIFVDGELNEEALMEFFGYAGALFEILEPIDREKSVLPVLSKEAHGHEADEVFDSPDFGRFLLLEDDNQILIAQLNMEQDLGMNEVFVQTVKADLTSQVFSVNQYNCFIPKACVAINAASNEIELSESFVRMMLDQKCQSVSSYGGGLSISKTVFVNAVEYPFAAMLEDGRDLFIDPLSEETVQAYQALFASLDTPVVVDKVIEAAINEELHRYLEGEASLEDAVSNCVKKISLYLAE